MTLFHMSVTPLSGCPFVSLSVSERIALHQMEFKRSDFPMMSQQIHV